MKKVLLLASITIGFFACGNKESAHDHDHEGHSHTTSEEAAATTDMLSSTVVDPICSMTKQDNWTEFTVQGSDTTWFCSPHCKELFDGNPDKYKL